MPAERGGDGDETTEDKSETETDDDDDAGEFPDDDISDAGTESSTVGPMSRAKKRAKRRRRQLQNQHDYVDNADDDDDNDDVTKGEVSGDYFSDKSGRKQAKPGIVSTEWAVT